MSKQFYVQNGFGPKDVGPKNFGPKNFGKNDLFSLKIFCVLNKTLRYNKNPIKITNFFHFLWFFLASLSGGSSYKQKGQIWLGLLYEYWGVNGCLSEIVELQVCIIIGWNLIGLVQRCKGWSFMTNWAYRKRLGLWKIYDVLNIFIPLLNIPLSCMDTPLMTT